MPLGMLEWACLPALTAGSPLASKEKGEYEVRANARVEQNPPVLGM